MKTKAQGAMEYLMTYGWAILVVMIVGLAMWRLGVFDLSQSATTSSGFTQIKPLLPSCKMSDEVYITGFDGFICQFTNTAGAEIRVKYINVTVNDEYCYGWYTSIYPEFDTNHKAAMVIAQIGGSVTSYGCNEVPTQGYCVDCGTFPPAMCAPGKLVIARDEVFSITAVGSHSHPTIEANSGPCLDISKGEPYKVYINMFYDIRIGGDTIEKSTSGVIRLSGE